MLSVGMLTCSQKANATGPTYLKVVNPLTSSPWFSYAAPNKSVGDTFVVNITVANVVNMLGWQFVFQWNSSLLEFVRAVFPSDHVFAGQNPIFGHPEIGVGWVCYGACSGPQQPGFSGSGVLAQLELNITRGIGESDLSFGGIDEDTFLIRMDISDIPFTPVIGFYDYNFHGDVNNDGLIDMKDVNLAVQAFNSFSNTLRWNPRADLDDNGRIDMRDIAVAVLNFNKHA